MSTLPQVTTDSFAEVDAREIKTGDIIDRGSSGTVLLRKVEGAYQRVAYQYEGRTLETPVNVTRIVYRKLGEGALMEFQVSHGGKVRRLIR